MKKAYKIRLVIITIIFVLIIAAFFGIYPVKFMDIQLGALIQRLALDFSITALILVSGLAVLTLLFGRIFCSLLCPLGLLQEFFSFVSKKKKPFNKNLPLKYFITAVVYGALFGFGAILLRYIDPYTIFGSALTLSIFGIVAIFAVLAIVFFKDRFFCSNICPTGAILALISKISINKIKINKDKCVSCLMCAKNCPTGSIDSKEKFVDNTTCVKCLKCLSVCKKDAISYGIKAKEEIKFSPKRRDFIYSISALALFGAAYKISLEYGKKVALKIKNIILPPGAGSEEEFSKKCLNCNLCVNNCPNKIIQKADSNFPFIHIDYSKGEGFCKYDCAECSKTCPSGAIKKIKPEDKQNIRIAMAILNKEKCLNCSICLTKCPKGAIYKDDNNIVTIDPSKCIGCARCSKECPNGAIEVFAIKNQRMI